VHLPDPVITADDPEQDAILADSVGLALLIVLDTPAPAERLVFVLHASWVDALLKTARTGDVAALITILDPQVVARSDAGPARPPTVTTGTESVAAQAAFLDGLADDTRSVLVNGAPGILAHTADGPFAVMSFVTAGDRITHIDGARQPRTT
jgi:hypothetical protein